jgi:hypothetical protein
VEESAVSLVDRFGILFDALDRARGPALRLAIALVAVVAALWVTLPQQTAFARRHHVYRPPRIYYSGVDTGLLASAIAPIWPQLDGPYCGIATAMAMVNFEDELRHQPLRFTSRDGQSAIATANQSAGESQWGHATPTNAVAGITNIAPDFGTDPRSIAYDAATYAPAGTPYHDYIYRWQFANRRAPPFTTQVAQATTSLARALRQWHEPISVTINAGEHSVLVTGVYTYSSSLAGYPASIASVVFSDPMAAPTVSSFRVDFYTWAHGHYATPAGVYSLWSAYYGSHVDPEPTVGPYTPTAAHPVHWYEGFTWIQPDGNVTPALLSPDLAFTATATAHPMTTP